MKGRQKDLFNNAAAIAAITAAAVKIDVFLGGTIYNRGVEAAHPAHVPKPNCRREL